MEPNCKKDSLSQCSPKADILFDNFRTDISCDILEEYKKRNVTLDDLLELQTEIPVIYPWNDNYDKLFYNVNRRFIVFSWAIVMTETKEHVMKAFKWAKEHNIPITTRSGGHCFEPFSLINGMIIDQSRRNKIKFLDEKIIAVQPGALQGPTQFKLAQYGLAFVGGTCPNTGMGLILGGGIGFLERKYGLSSDNLLEVEILLANGKVVRANEKEYNDLFFAIRGCWQ